MKRTAVKIKGEETFGHVIEGDEFCKEQEVFRYFVEAGTGRKLYDNFDTWEIKNGELDRYAKAGKSRPMTIKVGSYVFIG